MEWPICHVWYDRDLNVKTLYRGRLELKKKGGGTYVVAYWNPALGESYDDDAVDYNMTKFALAADFVFEDLVLS